MKRILLLVFILIITVIASGYYLFVNKPELFTRKKLPPQYAIDVIELKSGKKVMGKIIKETPDSVFVRYVDGTTEVSYLKKLIANIRKPRPEDLKIAQDEVNRAQAEAEKASIYNQEREARLSKFYGERYRSDVASKVRGQNRMNLVNAIAEAKQRGKVCSGMSHSDVVEVYGPPDRQEFDTSGKAPRERWYYGGLKRTTVEFYDGKVV